MGTVTLKVEKGVNNKHDPHKLGQITDFRDQSVKVLTQAQNVDIDDNGVVTMRPGRTQRISLTAPHSFWVHPTNPTIAYCVAEGILYKVNTDWTATAIGPLPTNDPVSYEVINGEICASDGVGIAWVIGAGIALFETPTDTLKTLMPAGKYLGFDVPDGSLIVASGNTIYKSDPYNAEWRDTRVSEFPLDSPITMLGWVEDGWWVGTQTKVAFIKREGAEGFTYVDVSDNPPPDGCFTQGWEDTKTGKARYVAWASVDGFCEGRAGGQFVNLSPDTALPTGTSGRLFSRTINGISQYVAIIYDPEGAETYTADSLVVNSISV